VVLLVASPKPRKKRKRCRHCRHPKVNRPRGLCWSCYEDPVTRAKYAPADPQGAHGATHATADFHGGRPLPAVPTSEPPGSWQKIELMAKRWAAGLHLHHPGDLSFRRRGGG
jgi:hypothetical protein